MIVNKPNVHFLQLYQNYYFYDVNTNAIVKLSPELYQYFTSESVKKDSCDLSEEAKRGLDYLYGRGLFGGQAQESSIHFETDLLKELYQNNLNTLTLQVTQNCNLRCRYCVYSGSYINRTHTKKRMSWETAKKAIDFLYEHSECSSNVAFGFYGGEPLLEIALMKKCLAYIDNIFSGKKKTFVITTNATLLNAEILQLLRQYDFSVMISLDGPQGVQDGNRIFADNKQGTFQTVMEKLDMIEKTAPDYLEKVTFNAVIDLKQDFNAANDFFLSYNMVKNAMVRGTFVNNVNRKERIDINYEYLIDSRYEEFKTMLYYCTDIFENYRPRLLRGYMETIKQNFADRDIIKNSHIQKSTTGGQCLPGIQRLFVTVDGKLYPCERVNENSEEFCIGDVEQGFDIEKAQRLLNVGQLTEQECRQCWCQKICSQCIAKADDNGHLSREQRLKNCKEAKDSAEKMIKDYIVLKKYGCKFDELEVES